MAYLLKFIEVDVLRNYDNPDPYPSWDTLPNMLKDLTISFRTIDTVVFGGMLASTLLAIPFVPVFYVIMQRLSERRREPGPATQKVAVSKKARAGAKHQLHAKPCSRNLGDRQIRHSSNNPANRH